MKKYTITTTLNNIKFVKTAVDLSQGKIITATAENVAGNNVVIASIPDENSYYFEAMIDYKDEISYEAM